MFDSVFDEILELFHLNLDDNLVDIWVVARAVALLVEVAGQAVRVVSGHPVRRITMVLVNVLG